MHVTRAGWIVATALVGGLAATALRAEGVIGDAAEPSLVFDVDVPHEALAAARAKDIEATWRARLHEYGVRTALTAPSQARSIGVRVTVVGATREHAAEVESALTSSATLEIRLVLAGTDAMHAVYREAQTGRVDLGPGVEAEVDSWRAEPTGAYFEDYYLRAPTTDALDRAIADLAKLEPLPEGASVAYERVEPYREAADPRPYYRTYVIAPDVILGNEHIAAADVRYDPNTLRPEVWVSMTDAGAHRFGDATAAYVGHKLAIMIDGRVSSAPVVQSAIRGGQMSITMGGQDPEQQQRDATALAGVLGAGGATGTLPAGIYARQVAEHARPMGIVWTMRLLFGLLAGAAAALLAWRSERERWFAVARDVTPGRERWDALALPALVTFLLPALVWYGATSFVMPGVNEIEMYNVLAKGDMSRSARATVGVFALGIVPVASGFLFVELYALLVGALVPSRRATRLGTPVDRRRLDRAAWILITGLAFLQAYFMAQYLDSLRMRGSEVLVGGDRTRYLVTITLAAGVMIQIFIAETISRHGLANGYLVLMGAAAAVHIVGRISPEAVSPYPGTPEPVMFAAIGAVAAFATLVTTRLRAAAPNGPRLPYTGLVPASLVRDGVGLLVIVALFSSSMSEELGRLQEWTIVAQLGATVPFTALILWSSRRPWTTPGVVATMAFVAVLVIAPFAVTGSWRLAVPLAEGVLVGILLAELWIGALTRVRIPDAVTVLVVHDVFRADEAADRLREAGVPCALLGVRARAALRMTGAFAPIAVRVPASRADEAAALLAPPPAAMAATAAS